MKMKIIYTFPDNSLYYNCLACSGLCCNLNATLIFKPEQIENSPYKKYLREYSMYEKNRIQVVCGKKCWFLKKDKCSLKEKEKPVGCKLYPVNVWKLDEEILVADIIPCPQMFYSQEMGIRYDETKRLIEELDMLIDIPHGKFAKNICINENINIKAQLEKYIKWRDKMFKDSFENSQDDLIKIFFAQIPLSPVIFNIEDISYNEVFVFYWNLYKKIQKEGIFDNLYNLFVLLRNATIKHVLYMKYFPVNKKVYSNLDYNVKIEYCHLYEKIQDNLLQSKEKIFDLFYYAAGTEWRLI